MKTRILAIAPYNGMKEIMNEIASANDDMELTVHVNTSRDGLEIVQSYDPDDFDIIVARGGTARLIEKNVKIPVVRIEISVYDILRVVKLAENYTSRFAIVGIPSTVENAKLLRNLLQYDFKIVTLSDPDEDRAAISELLTQGYEMVLCDMKTSRTAYELGMNHILITSGQESIEAAFTQAISTARLHSFYRWQEKLLKGSFIGSKETLFVYGKDKKLVFSSLNRNEANEDYFQIVEKHLDSFLADSSFRTEVQKNALLLSLYCYSTSIGGMPYFYIYLCRQNRPGSIEDTGICLYDNRDSMNSDSDFYGSANLIGITRKALESYSKTLQPILILGEIGTGKDKSASFIYQHSEYKNHPFFIIDCESTSQKKWNYFMESPNSPLNELHITIYIKNMQMLHESIARKLLPYIKQNDLCRRNRFLFSYALANDAKEDHFICQYLKNTLSCLVLHLQPLRNRLEDIPNIATLYISQSNIELGKQIVGFESDAMTQIQEFNWSQNLAQLKRVIRQLIVLTEGDYIRAEHVRQMLKQETPKRAELLKPGYEIVNTNQSLEEIDYDIIRMVLGQENMNRSKAAERLKISRSTLWRMLQR